MGYWQIVLLLASACLVNFAEAAAVDDAVQSGAGRDDYVNAVSHSRRQLKEFVGGKWLHAFMSALFRDSCRSPGLAPVDDDYMAMQGMVILNKRRKRQQAGKARRQPHVGGGSHLRGKHRSIHRVDPNADEQAEGASDAGTAASSATQRDGGVPDVPPVHPEDDDMFVAPNIQKEHKLLLQQNREGKVSGRLRGRAESEPGPEPGLAHWDGKIPDVPPVRPEEDDIFVAPEHQQEHKQQLLKQREKIAAGERLRRPEHEHERWRSNAAPLQELVFTRGVARGGDGGGVNPPSGEGTAKRTIIRKRIVNSFTPGHDGPPRSVAVPDPLPVQQ